MSVTNNLAVDGEVDPQGVEFCQAASEKSQQLDTNLDWLHKNMHPYFFITMKNEAEAVAMLAYGLQGMVENRRMILADRAKTLILACLNKPGTLYETLNHIQNRQVSYADFSESRVVLPGCEHSLEVQKFEFDRKSNDEIAQAPAPKIPTSVKLQITEALKKHYPEFDHTRRQKLMSIVWLNNRDYILNSPPRRVAQILWLYQQCMDHDGIYLDTEPTDDADGPDRGQGSRLFFGVGNPPERGFLPQVVEVFKRFNVTIDRAYCLTISNGVHPYFLSTFYVKTADGQPIERDSQLFRRLQKELYNTQILRSCSQTYSELVSTGLATGTDASFVSAMISFCHTNMAHTHPDSFDLEGITRAFHNHPNIALQLVKLFRTRFQPELVERDQAYQEQLQQTEQMIEQYNTGRRFLDDFRRNIFRCALTFIRNTLKTNFFVIEKHALAFRLDPHYLEELGDEFTCDLPADRPFRVTFFYGRFGAGFHIGFSDIARGGWRTLITQGRDDYVTAANTIFRENYVLAHTQHLKNKDIYEGGSKMVAVLDAGGEQSHEAVISRLYKLQFGFINAFLDIYVTEDGRAKDPRVVDYYGEDEPIELGPDENMHDTMVELVARQAVKRGYLLGSGIMSSKEVGINHKEYGVTSIGVVRCAEVAMGKMGIDMHNHPFSVKLTGGPNGDVAGNAMALMLDRCPQVSIRLIVDGTGAMFDPEGADHEALSKIVLKEDIEGYNPNALHPGGFILYRGQTRRDGIRELFKKVVCDDEGVHEQWITNDEFYREYNSLMFKVKTDLFIPAGGRPETLDMDNYERFFNADGEASAELIVEGANSFITPAARVALQKRGVVIMRDSSANKCGVISSSYEIIANLMLTNREFLSHKEDYVADVIKILNRRAKDEAELIFKRHDELGESMLFTEISDQISHEINGHYARLFNYFQNNPVLCEKLLYRKAILQHLPKIISDNARFRKRIDNLPVKIKYAILASEIASSMVYHSNEQDAFGELIESHLARMTAA